MQWLIIYDICDSKRLSKVAKLLEAFGHRIQRSVFEVSADRDIITSIEKRILLILNNQDSIVFIPLCTNDYGSIERIGKKLYDTTDEKNNDNTVFL